MLCTAVAWFKPGLTPIHAQAPSKANMLAEILLKETLAAVRLWLSFKVVVRARGMSLIL